MKINTPVGIALVLFVLLAGSIIAFGLLDPVKTDSDLAKTNPLKNWPDYTIVIHPVKKPGVEMEDGKIRIIPDGEWEEGERDDDEIQTIPDQNPPAPSPIVTPAPAPIAPNPTRPAPVKPKPLPPQPRRTRAS